MGIFDYRTESPLVTDFGDGSFRIAGSGQPANEVPQAKATPTKAPSIAVAIVIFVTSAGAAQAQYLRDAVQGFYGGIGAYGGGLCCGPGGVVMGGAGGAAVGGWVYDTQRNFWRQPPAPRFAPVYPSRQWGTTGSTPMYMRRRY